MEEGKILSKDHIIVTKRKKSDLVLHGSINRRENRIEQNHEYFGKNILGDVRKKSQFSHKIYK